MISLREVDPSPVRRVWQLLWGFSLFLILLLLVVTLTDQPFAPEAYRHFSAETLETGRRFSREVRVVGSIHALLSLTLMAVLCFHPVGARLLQRLEALGRGRLWLSLVAVGTGVTLMAGLLDLPFAFYLGHLHEKAYGLSLQTSGQWLADHLMGVGVGLGISLLLWLPLWWLIRRWPRTWWAPATLLHLGYSGLMILLYPLVLMPLFNQMLPVRDPQVLMLVSRLADRAGVEVSDVREMVVSDSTNRVNAMVTGLGPSKQVIVYDTLLQQFAPAEVEVVMAHELAHAIHQDVAINWLVNGGTQAVLLFAAAWMLQAMVGVGALRMPSAHAARGLVLFLLFTSLTGQMLEPPHQALSRHMEVRADRFALEMTGNPEAFLTGFKKLADGNPGDVDPPVLVEWFSHSHPSIIRRIRAAEQFRLEEGSH